jgi:hypothetical protein
MNPEVGVSSALGGAIGEPELFKCISIGDIENDLALDWIGAVLIF